MHYYSYIVMFNKVKYYFFKKKENIRNTLIRYKPILEMKTNQYPLPIGTL